MPGLWTTLLLLLIPMALRAFGRLLAARRLALSLASVRLGVGPVIVRRTSGAGVVWTVGLLPLPVVRLEPVEPKGPGALARRAALALSGPVTVYLAGALLVAATLVMRGQEHETNIVEVVPQAATAARRGHDDPLNVRELRPGDRIVAVYDRPTPDGESIRRFVTWLGLEGEDEGDGELWGTILRDGNSRPFIISPVRSSLRLPAGLQASPELGVALHLERHHVGILQAVRLGLAFPCAQGSAIRWLVEAAVPRVQLDIQQYPITHLPSLRQAAWPIRLADLLGFFALLSILPWPGLDGGELLLVAYEALRGKRLPPWLEGLFRSWGWGAAMAAAVALITLRAPDYVIHTLFEAELPLAKGGELPD